MKLRWLCLLALVPAAMAMAEVTLPKVLTNHMVVQRDLPVHMWGFATPGETVTVEFRGETEKAKATELGRWSVYLKPGAAGGPFQMTVSGDAQGEKPAVLDDVFVGDVWVASGQSNMEFEMRKAETASEDLPKAGIANLRLMLVKRVAVNWPQDDVQSDGWAVSSPETAKEFSAVAWYFAREIAAREHVAVGVIDTTWGGTPVEAWTRMAALGADAAVNPLFQSWGKMQERQADALLRDKDLQRRIAEAKAQGKTSPTAPWVPRAESWQPGNLYNGMIAPLTPFAIKGAIWYQGEANGDAERGPLYGRIFRDMIEDWRREWGVGDFPFLFVQLANFKPGTEWPTLRDEQLKTLELKNTGMAVTIDIGNPTNVHPTDKLDVGLRLSRAARVLAYGEQIEDSGPIYRQATMEGAAIRAWFDHAKGLAAKSGEPTGFEVAGADGKFVAATAKIEGASVVVSSPDVKEPVAVRYGWAANPECNLYNGEGLPASPFNSARK
ncbi:MAG: sialate O-acetylesterase [Terracidiphilus sp.]|nr:sialate O-acetylesterase [Terracidiphilus sp.]